MRVYCGTAPVFSPAEGSRPGTTPAGRRAATPSRSLHASSRPRPATGSRAQPRRLSVEANLSAAVSLRASPRRLSLPMSPSAPSDSPVHVAPVTATVALTDAERVALTARFETFLRYGAGHDRRKERTVYAPEEEAPREPDPAQGITTAWQLRQLLAVCHLAAPAAVLRPHFESLPGSLGDDDAVPPSMAFERRRQAGPDFLTPGGVAQRPLTCAGFLDLCRDIKAAADAGRQATIARQQRALSDDAGPSEDVSDGDDDAGHAAEALVMAARKAERLSRRRQRPPQGDDDARDDDESSEGDEDPQKARRLPPGQAPVGAVRTELAAFGLEAPLDDIVDRAAVDARRMSVSNTDAAPAAPVTKTAVAGFLRGGRDSGPRSPTSTDVMSLGSLAPSVQESPRAAPRSFRLVSGAGQAARVLELLERTMAQPASPEASPPTSAKAGKAKPSDAKRHFRAAARNAVALKRLERSVSEAMDGGYNYNFTPALKRPLPDAPHFLPGVVARTGHCDTPDTPEVASPQGGVPRVHGEKVERVRSPLHQATTAAFRARQAARKDDVARRSSANVRRLQQLRELKEREGEESPSTEGEEEEGEEEDWMSRSGSDGSEARLSPEPTTAPTPPTRSQLPRPVLRPKLRRKAPAPGPRQLLTNGGRPPPPPSQERLARILRKTPAASRDFDSVNAGRLYTRVLQPATLGWAVGQPFGPEPRLSLSADRFAAIVAQARAEREHQWRGAQL